MAFRASPAPKRAPPNPAPAPAPNHHAPPKNAPNPVLWTLCRSGGTRQVQEILMRGTANVEEQGHLDSRWSTPLAIAARVGASNLVMLLLDHRGDIHAHGRTILHDAIKNGHTPVVMLLLRYGADVSARDFEGCTPLAIAARGPGRAHFTIAEELVKKHHVDVNVVDDNGCTALHHAAIAARPDMVKLLIHHGVNVPLATRHGRTAEWWAAHLKHDEVVAMIQTETLPKAKCVAFAMGLQERLGAGSRVSLLDPGVLQIVLQYVE